jgi:beta-N-acetylhexosaminidase
MAALPGSTYSPAAKRLIADYHIGGVALFSYNVSSPPALTDFINQIQNESLQNGARIPLLVAADQEGGLVLRLWPSPFSRFPSPMALGAADDPALTFQVGVAMAEEMRACGLNMNLAPVLDVNTLPNNPVINLRAFGDDPGRVAEQGRALLQGLQSMGVAATGKHFPGHGSTTSDSHYELPVVSLNREQLLAEMIPFQVAIDAGLEGMMTAHVVYQGLDNTPATFSKPILTDLLRLELGFEGVLISDALTMRAVSQAREEVAYRLRDALLAGVDMLAYGALPDGSPPSLEEQVEVLDTLHELVEANLVPLTRVEEAAGRVLRLKEQFGLLDWSALGANTTSTRLNTLAHQELLQTLADRAITLWKNETPWLPLQPGQTFGLVYPAGHEDWAAALRDVPGLMAEQTYSNFFSVRQTDDLLRQAKNWERALVLIDTPSQNDDEAFLFEVLAKQTPCLMVAMASPYELAKLSICQNGLLTYGDSPHLLRALRKVLSGELMAGGRLPVRL